MEKALLAGFTAVESAHFFSAFCPSLFTIKTFADTDEKKQAVRMGYIPSIVFSVVLGFVVSKVVKSWIPLVLAVAVDIGMVGAYEFAMR